MILILTILIVLVVLRLLKIKWAYLIFLIFPVITFIDLTARDQMALNLSIAGYLGFIVSIIFNFGNNVLNYCIVYYSLFFSFFACFLIYKNHSLKAFIKNLNLFYKKISYKLIAALSLICVFLLSAFYNQTLRLFSMVFQNNVFGNKGTYYFIEHHFTSTAGSSFNQNFSIIYTILFFCTYVSIIFFDRQDFFQKTSFILVFFLCFPIISIKNNELKYFEEPYKRSLIIAPLGYALFSTSIACIEDNKINQSNQSYSYFDFKRRQVISQSPPLIASYTFFQILSVSLLLPSMLILKQKEEKE